MQIALTGTENGLSRRCLYHLFDRFDPATGISSMARTTGYTCTAVARLVLAEAFSRHGICPPEYVGAEESCFQRVIADLRARQVIITSTTATGQ